MPYTKNAKIFLIIFIPVCIGLFIISASSLKRSNGQSCSLAYNIKNCDWDLIKSLCICNGKALMPKTAVITKLAVDPSGIGSYNIKTNMTNLNFNWSV